MAKLKFKLGSVYSLFWVHYTLRKSIWQKVSNDLNARQKSNDQSHYAISIICNCMQVALRSKLDL